MLSSSIRGPRSEGIRERSDFYNTVSSTLSSSVAKFPCHTKRRQRCTDVNNNNGEKMATVRGLLFAVCLLLLPAEFCCGVKLRVVPNAFPLRKYVGDSLNLTCFVEYRRQDEETKPQLDWVVPTNSEERVQISETSNMLRVTIIDLKETDGGNYTCSLKSELKAPVKKSVMLVILPRGRISYCLPDRFSCGEGSCIAKRYECDGVPDCLDGSDESMYHCGKNTCAGKLSCDDGRCLSHKMCCQEKGLSPPNCTIRATIQCCRQLVHPALLDPDLYYMDVKQSLQQDKTSQPDSTLIMGCIVAVANLVTVAIIVEVRYHLWRSNGTSSRPQHRLSRLRSATFRPFAWISSQSPASNTDQHQLRAADSPYSRRIPGLRSDLLTPEIVHEQRQQSSRRQWQCTGGVVLCPPTHSQPPQYSQLPTLPQGPPPSYHQVVGAPPPPYRSRDDLSSGALADNNPLAILAPLLPFSFHNNNGDINSDNTTQLTVAHDHNANATPAAAAAPIIASTSSTSHNTSTHPRNK